jgi:hypothetical protein
MTTTFSRAKMASLRVLKVISMRPRRTVAFTTSE